MLQEIILILGLINGNLLGVQNFASNSIGFDNVYYETVEGSVDSIENSSQIYSIENDEVDVLIFLKDPVLEISEPIKRPKPSNLGESANFLENYREKISELIYENNISFLTYLEKLLPNEEFFVSHTSPYVSFSIDEYDINTTLASNIKVLSNDLNVDSIYFREPIEGDSFTDSYIPFSTATDYIKVSDMIESKRYTGRDINVGFIESTLLNTTAYSGYSSSDGDYYNKSILLKNSSRSGTNYDHIAQTTMIAAGKNGIASGANILSASSGDNFQDNLTWMVNNDVNVLNTSFSYLGSALGNYSSYSKIADQMIHDYLYTHVSSAGNLSSANNSNNELGSPATGFNVIAVGNTSSSKSYVSSSSSYKKDNGYYGGKPNIVAPGAVITNSYNKEGADGTSFSAPEVSGCIALLMEEFPYLVAYPELVTSIVTSSASPMSSIYNNESGDNHYDASGLHNQIGSGLLNYEKMREAAKQYLSITVPKSKSSYTGSLDQYLEFRVPNDKRIRASLAWLANGTDENNFTDYDLYLTRVEPDGTENNVMRVYGSANNVEFLDYAVETGGLFRLRVWKSGQSNQNDFLGLSYVTIDDNGGSTSGATERVVPTLGEVEFKTADYSSFGNVYNNTAIEKTITASSGERIDTKRLRAAIVDNHLVLSAKNKDAGLAYLEYYFDDYINTIEYDFGLWSDNESLIKNSFISLQCYQGNGYWYNVKEFKAKEMGQDKDLLLHYETDFPILTTAFRFVVQTNMVENDNNRGRVVIGDITVS